MIWPKKAVLEELERKEVPSQTHGFWSFLVYLCGVGHESSPPK